MKTMKNFKIIDKLIEYESIVAKFSSGGAYIPSKKKYAGRKVKVIVLPNA